MLLESVDQGKRLNLYDPVKMPKASAFLWNQRMMIHMNCRGFAVSQFMQPEPAKYAHAPNLEAKTFMQPEQPYYAHHAGRFCYIQDLDDNSLFSVPHEPVKSKPDSFCFSAGQSDILWRVKYPGLEVNMELQLTADDLVELWTISLRNTSPKKRNLRLFPYFPVGYMSWMNQSAAYESSLGAIVCSSVSPYQKYQEYDKVKLYKDKTFLMAGSTPDAYEANQQAFEGEGGLVNPDAIQQGGLRNGDAIYEMPACVFQYNLELETDELQEFKFIFGPAKDVSEIGELKKKYLGRPDGFERANKAYASYIKAGSPCLHIATPDKKLNDFVNHWLPRQIYYHGETNRLSTDPQTRNYLQDNMGMSYIRPLTTREAFVTALSQQKSSGAMPDGILIDQQAELKYINQVPHTDHCVWLPVCLKAYLDETNDTDLLHEMIGFSDNDEVVTFADHINRAMTWLLDNRDERGLNYINQGDWCDPMNMVGYKGKGVSGWLSMATSYALKTWIDICETFAIETRIDTYNQGIASLNQGVNKYLWDGNWFARGITDDNVVFGIKEDPEGRIFLNPQAWSLLSNCADQEKEAQIIAAVAQELESPFGVEMLSPSFTHMREDIGRVTQKHPGSAENGSVYNHAAAFYIYALYTRNHYEKAYDLLTKMIPGPEEADLLQRGQIPVFIPNYYRGAHKQFPRTAGRSSQLFNTGTVHWIYRCMIEGLFGLKGEPEGLRIDPQLPDAWNQVTVTRNFRGAIFHIHMQRISGISDMQVIKDGQLLSSNLVVDIQNGKSYGLEVKIPVS